MGVNESRIAKVSRIASAESFDIVGRSICDIEVTPVEPDAETIKTEGVTIEGCEVLVEAGATNVNPLDGADELVAESYLLDGEHERIRIRPNDE